MLALPVIGWLVFFLLIPMGFVAVYSFLSRGPYGNVIFTFTTNNYPRAGDALYLGIYWQSVQLAIAATVVCLALGFPAAYVIATAPRRWRQLLVTIIMAPFLVNFIVRAYAIRVLLGIDGPINRLLLSLAIISSPLGLNDTWFAVWLGMVTNYLPFMVLPLYVVLDRLDFGLLEAAADLGASGPHVLRYVLLPLAWPGILSGAVLVFVPALGEFMIPDILGGARTMLIGNLISDQFLRARHWPFGATLAVLLIGVMLLGCALEWRFGPEDGDGRLS